MSPCFNQLSNEKNPCSNHFQIHVLFEHGFNLQALASDLSPVQADNRGITWLFAYCKGGASWMRD